MKTDAFTVIIVGAGPAGIGCALALQAAGVTDVLLIEQKAVGASFEAWPQQMKLLTPSFYSNAFGYADLNSISPDSSPADLLGTQHPSGKEYATYLRAVVNHHSLLVQSGVRVTSLDRSGEGFELHTSQGLRKARYVIWACGEFSTPDDRCFPGAEICVHNSRVADWEALALTGDRFALVGGYESGIDAAINLMWLGKEVHLLARGHPWESDDPDPSRSLSPYTRDRMKGALLEAQGTVHFYKNAEVTEVRAVSGGFELSVRDGKPFFTSTQPVLCTGFRSALEPISDLWAWQDGQALFTEEADESTLTPGLFYSGPSLHHRGMLFCFIYKFRSRFGVIAQEIARRMGLSPEDGLLLWRQRGFLQEDLRCCTDCRCAVGEQDGNAETPTSEVLEYANAA